MSTESFLCAIMNAVVNESGTSCLLCLTSARTVSHSVVVFSTICSLVFQMLQYLNAATANDVALELGKMLAEDSKRHAEVKIKLYVRGFVEVLAPLLRFKSSREGISTVVAFSMKPRYVQHKEYSANGDVARHFSFSRVVSSVQFPGYALQLSRK